MSGPARRRAGVPALAAVAVLALAATAVPAADREPAGPPPAGTVFVFAAASLGTVLGDLGDTFARRYPGARVETNLAASSTLARQLEEGAAADVFASADEAQMERLVARGLLAGPPVRFARNRLAIAVAPGNPLGIARLADLLRPGLVVVLAGTAVPAGHYALAAFARAGVAPPAGSRELDVKAVVARVALGEADAGVVYTTDVRAAAGGVEGVAVPDAENVVASYPIAVLRGAPNPVGARAFVALVGSPEGRAALARHGFLPP